jgi:uncharacterized membrane protein YkvA (DUF1232 family)
MEPDNGPLLSQQFLERFERLQLESLRSRVICFSVSAQKPGGPSASGAVNHKPEVEEGSSSHAPFNPLQQFSVAASWTHLERLMFSRLKILARKLSRDAHAIYLASRDPRVPWYAKFLAIAVAAYALSPIDLIPDFIPVVGYLDDLIILPCGIWLAVSLIPAEVMAECRAKADAAGRRPVSRGGLITIIVLWILATVTLGWVGYAHWSLP